MESRCKFIRLSKYRELYINYSWDHDSLWLTINKMSGTKEQIISLSTDRAGIVTKLSNFETVIYEKEKEQ